MSDRNLYQLRDRRPRSPAQDRAEIAGALWAIQTAMDWARDTAITFAEPELAAELDTIAERLYTLTDALYDSPSPPEI